MIKKSSMKESKIDLFSKKYKHTFFLIFGIIFLAGIVFATTTITDQGITTGGDVQFNNRDSVNNASKINGACYVQVNNASDIQSKINSCGTNLIYIPDGNYDLTVPLQLPSGTRLVGYSVRGTYINCDNLATSCVKASNGIRVYDIKMQNINIQGNRTIGQKCLDFTNISTSTFEDVRVTGCDVGLYGNGLNYYNDFKDLVFVSSNTNILLDSATNQNNFIGGYSTGSATGGIMFNITGGSNQNNFLGTSFEGTNQRMYISSSAYNNNFYSNRFEMVGTSNLTDDGSNYFSGGYATGIDFYINGNTGTMSRNLGYSLRQNGNGAVGFKVNNSGDFGSTYSNTPSIWGIQTYSVSGTPLVYRADVYRRGYFFEGYSSGTLRTQFGSSGTLLLNSNNVAPYPIVFINTTSSANANDTNPIARFRDNQVSSGGTPAGITIELMRGGGKYIRGTLSDVDKFWVGSTNGDIWSAGTSNVTTSYADKLTSRSNGNINATSNVIFEKNATILQGNYQCYNLNCSAYQYYNGSTLIIKVN